MIAGLALPLTAWVCIAGMWFGFMRYRGLHEISLSDVLLPTRWQTVRVVQGSHLIGEAFQFARADQWSQAWLYLQRGLHKAPAHRAGRILLAQLQLEARQPEAARQTLVAGLASHRHDPNYLLTLFRVLLRQEEDRRAVSVACLVLNSSRSSPASNRVAALAGAWASFHRGDYDQSDHFLGAVPQLASSPEGRLLAAKNDWERGYQELALVRLRALADERPADADIHAELFQRLREVGAHDEVRRRSIALQLARPDLPGPRIEQLYAYQHTGDVTRLAREFEDVLQEFATNSAALLAVADFAAHSGNPAFAARVLQQAKASQLAWEPHALLHLEALVAAGRYREAIETARALVDGQPELAQRHRAVLDSLKAIAHHAIGDVENARLFLASFLGQSGVRTEHLLAVANRFVALDGSHAARDALLRAVDLDASNQAALTRLVEINLNLNRIDELPAQLLRLVAMRKPSPDVLRVAQHKLGSDLFLFSADRDRALEAVRVTLETRGALASR